MTSLPDTLGGPGAARVANRIGGRTRAHDVIQSGSIGAVHLYADRTGPGADLPSPAQHPRLPVPFVDRDEERAAAGLALGNGRLVVVFGPAGSGRTALAGRVLQERGGTLPGGRVFADLRMTADPLEILSGWLPASGAAAVPATLQAAQGMWRTVTARRPTAALIVGGDDPVAVEALLPADGSLVVVTALRPQPRLVVHGAVHVPVGPLPDQAALELLADRSGRDFADPGCRAAALRVIAACAHLPLAVVLAGAQLQADPGLTPAALAAALSGTQTSDPSTDLVGNTVSTALSQAYSSLPPGPAAAYRALGVTPGRQFSAPLVAAALGIDLDVAAAHLLLLEQRSLVRQTAPGVLGALFEHVAADTGRTHAAEAAASESPETCEAMIRGAVGWWLAATSTAMLLAVPDREHLSGTRTPPTTTGPVPADQEQSWRWLKEQTPAIRPMAEAAADLGLHRAVWQIAEAAFPIVHRERNYPLLLWLFEFAAQHARLDPQAGPGPLRQMLNTLAAGLQAVGRRAESRALLREALAATNPDSTDRLELLARAQHLHAVGSSYADDGNPLDALPHLECALQLRTELGYDRGVALTRITLADCRSQLGHHTVALQLLRQARPVLAREPLEVMRVLAYTGRALTRAGHPSFASDLLNRAFAQAEKLETALWTARLMEWLALAEEQQGRLPDARSLFLASKTIYTLAASESDKERIAEHLRRISAQLTAGVLDPAEAGQ